MQNSTVQIKAPNMKYAKFELIGDAPLVVHRFSSKTKNEMLQKAEGGKSSGSKKKREAQDSDKVYEESKYISTEGWEGFNASAIRAAMISACRLVGFKMTLAKMSLFVMADGWDAKEPQIPLIKIYGKGIRQDDMARVETGQPYVTIRTAYHSWKAIVNIRWDADQFSIQDVSNLLMRVGMQVGICEGRPDSKNSAGMGWGLFHLGETAIA